MPGSRKNSKKHSKKSSVNFDILQEENQVIIENLEGEERSSQPSSRKKKQDSQSSKHQGQRPEQVTKNGDQSKLTLNTLP